jgi:hypothetical protein
MVGKPLLATSVHVDEHLDEHTEVPDTGGRQQPSTPRRPAHWHSFRAAPHGCFLPETSCRSPLTAAHISLSAGTMLDLYGNRGIDFIVDVGRRVATESTIIDMTTSHPEVLREGAGDASLFL